MGEGTPAAGETVRERERERERENARTGRERARERERERERENAIIYPFYGTRENTVIWYRYLPIPSSSTVIRHRIGTGSIQYRTRTPLSPIPVIQNWMTVSADTGTG